jgi:Protein of unknown function (DUF2959)
METVMKTCAPLLLSLLAAASCASPTERAEAVQRVDDLLAKIERVQVDSVVSKETGQAPLDQLESLCAPGFSGDAKEVYAHLLETIDHSEKQSKKLKDSVEPMRQSAESIFRQWTTDLQAFGNARMRQRSQARLDETQSRYQAVFANAQSALIAYDAYNADLKDLALFLGHDLNASAVAELATDIQGLKEEMHQVGVRMDAVANAARVYVEASALYGQSESEKAVPESKDPKATDPAAQTPSKKRPSTLKKKTGTPEATPEPAPTPAPSSVATPPPDPAPLPSANPKPR